MKRDPQSEQGHIGLPQAHGGDPKAHGQLPAAPRDNLQPSTSAVTLLSPVPPVLSPPARDTPRLLSQQWGTFPSPVPH